MPAKHPASEHPSIPAPRRTSSRRIQDQSLCSRVTPNRRRLHRQRSSAPPFADSPSSPPALQRSTTPDRHLPTGDSFTVPRSAHGADHLPSATGLQVHPPVVLSYLRFQTRLDSPIRPTRHTRLARLARYTRSHITPAPPLNQARLDSLRIQKRKI